jgi:predicted aldo/keto reductase-like oxidoreductase
VLRRAGELGVNFVDTDHSYSYQDPQAGRVQVWGAIKDWLGEVDRTNVVVATKTYKPTTQGALEDAEEALAGLGTDYLDIFMLHGLNTLEEWEKHQPALEGCLRAKEQGLVRHVGMSTHTVTLAREAAKHPELEVLLVTLNCTGKVMKRSGTPGEMQEAMRVLFEQGRGVYVMKPLARRRIFADSEEIPLSELPPLTSSEVKKALGYVFRCPWAHSIAVGMRRVEEVTENAGIQDRVDTESGRWEAVTETLAG